MRRQPFVGTNIALTVEDVNASPMAVDDVYTAFEGVPYVAALGFDDLVANDTEC